jgi:salicylate hydroxylase
MPVTHRADIHAAILNACPERQPRDFGNAADRREPSSRTRTVSPSVLQSGERVRGRALIGCDGMWSKIRDKIVGDGKPRVSGHIAYRAVLKKDDVPPTSGART